MNNILIAAEIALAYVQASFQRVLHRIACAKFVLFRTVISSLLLLVALSGCDYKNCLPENSFVSIQSTSSVARANARQTAEPDGRGGYLESKYGVWIDSGINADGKNQLEIIAEGTISTCSSSTQKIVVPATFGEKNHNHWTNSGLSPAKGDKLLIEVKAPQAGFCNYDTPKTCTSYDNCVSMWDNNSGSTCIQNGQSLFAFIGSSPDNSAKLELKANNTDFTGWGTNNPAAVPNGGFSGQLTNLSTQGNLYLQITDSGGTWDCCLHDNHGGYAVKITLTKPQPPASCIYKNGQLLDAMIVPEGIVPYNRTDGTLLNVNGGYKGIPSQKGRIWLRVHDNQDTIDDYIDNSGNYYVTVQKTVLDNHTVSSFVNSITRPIQNMLDEITQIIYSAIIHDHEFRRIVKACLLLFVILYATFFMLGLIKDKQTDMVIKVAKVGVILALLSNDSWEFFNTYFFSLFSEGSQFLINAATGGSGGEANHFVFLDLTIGQFFTNTTWQKLASLLFAGPFGIIYCFIIIRGFYTYLCAIVEAVVAYLISLVAISVMLIMAPFFLIFLLFSVTKPLFDAWVSHIFNFALQPAMLFAALALFNEFMVIAFYGVLNFRACWICAYPFIIPIGTLNIPASIPFLGGSSANLDINLGCWLWYFAPEGYKLGTLWSPPALFTSCIVFLIISDACRRFVVTSADIVAMLTEAGGGGDRLGFSGNDPHDTIMARLEAAPVSIGRYMTGTDGQGKERRTFEKSVQETMERMQQAAAEMSDAALGGSNDPDNPPGASSDASAPMSPSTTDNTPEARIDAAEKGIKQKKKDISSREEALAAKTKELSETTAPSDPEARRIFNNEKKSLAAQKALLQQEKEALTKEEENLTIDKKELRAEQTHTDYTAQAQNCTKAEEALQALRDDGRTAPDSPAMKEAEEKLAQEHAKLQQKEEAFKNADTEVALLKQKKSIEDEEKQLTHERQALAQETRHLNATGDHLEARQKELDQQRNDSPESDTKAKAALQQQQEELNQEKAAFQERKEMHHNAESALAEKENNLEKHKEEYVQREQMLVLQKKEQALNKEASALKQEGTALARDKETLAKQEESLTQTRKNVAEISNYLSTKGPELDQQAEQLEHEMKKYEERLASIEDPDERNKYEEVKGAALQEKYEHYMQERHSYEEKEQSLESSKLLEASLEQPTAILKETIAERQEAFDIRNTAYNNDRAEYESQRTTIKGNDSTPS